MSKYIEYIENLLYLHDCVILPGFGGFICNYIGATTNPKTGLFTPPRKTIVFNKHLQQNDGLLIHWIARQEQISYEKAERRLALFREEIKIRLNQKQDIEFGKLGVFHTDRHFNIVFEPTHQNFLPDTIGMESIQIHPSPNDKKTETCINTESGNIIHRLFKYGLSAAVIAGIVVISQQDIFHENSSIKTANMQLVSIKEKTDKPTQHPLISPDYDFVEYDPAISLNVLEDNHRY